jgi:multidrug transporter EmrE-like cation transporter
MECSAATYAIGLALLISMFEISAQTSLRTFQSTNHWSMLTIGIVLYTVVAFVLCYSYRNVQMGSINLTWSCLSIINAFLVGWLLFGERISVNGWVAIGFALMAVCFASQS